MGFGASDQVGDLVSYLGIEIFDDIGHFGFLHCCLVSIHHLITEMAVTMHFSHFRKILVEHEQCSRTLFFGKMVEVESSACLGDTDRCPGIVFPALFPDEGIKLIDNQVTEYQGGGI